MAGPCEDAEAGPAGSGTGRDGQGITAGWANTKQQFGDVLCVKLCVRCSAEIANIISRNP